ncbi:MAG: histidinol-phosphate transaminase [Prevotella sp.]|nr:histidinol-phosphate transaminase [Prevotella sp.]
MKELKELVRDNIWKLKPYSSARDEYSGHVAHVFIDANENPYNTSFNRYPDPLQRELKQKIARIKGVEEDCIFLGNGSDEAIDLVYRCFCNPMVDNVVSIEPTYGMYKVCADINNVEYRKVLLDNKFAMNAEDVLAACDTHTKVIWICTPNNPSGNDICRSEIEHILNTFQGIVVIDEAYSDFSQQKTFRTELSTYPNMIVLNTMSKAWGCAGIRLGMAFASPEIIGIFNKVKYPYNVNCLTQEKAAAILDNIQEVQIWVAQILEEKARVIEAFGQLDVCVKIYPSAANFFLVEVTDAQSIYDYLVNKGIIVRNRSQIALCKNCLRITIGNRTENNELLAALRVYK